MPAPRVRQGRAVANDARILDAAEAILAHDGWEDASVLRVAEHAGLSRRAVLSRYGDRSGVASAVWSSRLADSVNADLAAVVDARLQPRASENAPALVAALEPFLDPSPTLRAAAEVLIVSSFEPGVHHAVQSTLTSPLEAWLTPTRGRLSRVDASRNAAVIALALGFLVESRSYPDGIDMDIAGDVIQISKALEQDVAPRRLPADRAAYLDAEPVLDPDQGMAAMLAATLRLVGRHGYEAATIDRIAAECGRTSGFIFGHYRHKRELFLDATKRLLSQTEAMGFEFQTEIARRTSSGVADATMIREFMRPEHQSVRTITLEQYRLSWHDDDVHAAFIQPRTTAVERIREGDPALTARQARGQAFIGLARGVGYGLLAQLHPEAYALPIDVVSVPLIDG